MAGPVEETARPDRSLFALTPQGRVRLWAHDRACINGEQCPDRIEHAKRTQTGLARDVVRAHRAGESIVPALHDHQCLGRGHETADERAAHIAAMEVRAAETGAVGDLLAALGEMSR